MPAQERAGLGVVAGIGAPQGRAPLLARDARIGHLEEPLEDGQGRRFASGRCSGFGKSRAAAVLPGIRVGAGVQE